MGHPRSALGPVLSASNIGVLFGSALFGWIGDRYGRKPALIGGNLLFGVLTFAAAYSTDLTQLFWLRLFAGFGIGGVIPNVVAHVHRIGAAAVCARRCRSSPSAACRSAVRLPVSSARLLVPHYGWQILFQVGGIVPIVIALAAIVGLPESIKYMALHESQRPRDGKVDRRAASRFRRAGERPLCHRGREADRRPPIRSICSATACG